MRKTSIGIGGLLLISLVVISIRLWMPRAVADVDTGLSPFTAAPLNDGRNTGVLPPGEARWYKVIPGGYGDGFQQQMDLTLFFTPDDGQRVHRVNFQIFPADQIASLYANDVGQRQNLGSGGLVSRDGNPVTGERLWSGWLTDSDTYFIQVFNGADVTIDYYLFTADVIAAELGTGVDLQPVEDVSTENAPGDSIVPSPTSSPAPDVPVGADVARLLPQASELQHDRLAVEQESSYASGGVPTRMTIPAIALDSEVVPVGWETIVISGMTYGQWSTAESRVGWHSLSARLGQAGNTVLSGHSDIHAEVFRNLEYVQVGDEIVIFNGEQAHHYVVTQTFLVKEDNVSLEERIENAKWIGPTQDERLTLVTCANPGASHRLIVVARPLLAEG